MVEQEQHIEFLVVWIGDVLVTRSVHTRRLADVHIATALLEHLTTHLLQELVDARAVGGERVRARVPFWAGRVVIDLGTRFARKTAVLVDHLGDLRDHVHTEAVDALIHPPVHHPVDGLAHVGVLPVEVGLFLGVLVEEVLATLGVILPCGTTEVGAPFVRLGARCTRFHARFGGAPPVPVGFAGVGVA